MRCAICLKLRLLIQPPETWEQLALDVRYAVTIQNGYAVCLEHLDKSLND